MPSIRVKLLESLQKGPKTVNQPQQDTGMSQRTIFFHLDELQMLKVVKDNKTGSSELTIEIP
jgi:predicted transcriptional regulator